MLGRGVDVVVVLLVTLGSSVRTVTKVYGSILQYLVV